MAVNLYAVEPNESARKILQQQNIRSLHMEIGCLGTMTNLMLGRSKKDVVFTCGVLIHIPPDMLDGALRDIYDMSNRYIICAEYFSPQEREIKYQGRDGLLWTRDYGSLFLDKFKGLRCVSFGFSWKRITGMDNLTWWVFEKVN